jgi:GTP cyclohydrolase I
MTKARRKAPSPSGSARPDAAALRAAFAGLLDALELLPQRERARTASRAAELWREHLLAGVGVDLAGTLGEAMPTRSHSPVSLRGIGVHLVCPHHLTVAFGEARLAYVPGGRIVGFGALTRLAAAATSRMVLQEEATEAMASALVEHLGARAAVAVIEAIHPCHNLLHPRSHGARALTVAARGRPAECRRLEALLTSES